MSEASDGAGSSWLRAMYEAFAPIREELGEKYSEDEIDEAIDQAVNAVRLADRTGPAR